MLTLLRVLTASLGISYPRPHLTIVAASRILKRMVNRAAELDRVFQALADPGRRVMVERLSRGPASVSELARPLPMSLPAVLHHVQVREATRLTRTENARPTPTPR